MDPNPTPNVHDRRPTCTLELLTTDVLVAVLSASESLADLHALIRASPLIYDCFLSYKQSILLSIVSQELGPVIRDAVALSRMQKLDWYTADYHDRARYAVQQYGDQLSAGMNATRGLAIDNVIEIIQFNRTVQFFVDLIASMQLAYVRQIHPEGSYELSTVERQRFAQALIRHQILMRVHPGLQSPHNLQQDEDSVILPFTALFTGWEMEQLSEVHGHLLNICCALADSESCESDRRRKLMLDWVAYGDDLDTYRRKIVEARYAYPALKEGMSLWLLSKRRYIRGTLGFLTASQRVLRAATFGAARDELDRRKRADPALVAGASAADPPYAWVDGHGGRNCRRWGMGLEPVSPPGQLLRWQWMGFMFWDKERVEMLKEEPTTFSHYQTCWLNLERN